MEGTKYTTKEAVLKRGQELIGIPLKEIDTTGRISTGKGAIGTVIEESWYGYTPNSESEPDFPEAGVELKVTPYVKKKGEIRAKERLVCNIINYMEEYSRTFETSSFWHKCQTMLLMSYQHLIEKEKGDFMIDAAVLFSFPEEDLMIIENDWKKIMEKVRCGKAHELSEGDTMYLAACTKGANAQTTREQPFSDVPAKQRAYSLKASYMTQILNKYIFGKEESNSIIKDWHKLHTESFEDHIIKTVSKYYGKTQEELALHFNVSIGSKAVNEILLAKMFGIRGRIQDSLEFKKAGIMPKTIRVRKNGTIKESMSFATFDFIEMSQEEEWEESDIYNIIAPARFLFVIFKERADGKYVFERVMFWNIPIEDLDEVRKVWEKAVTTIRRGVKLIPGARGISNDLPKIKDNPVAHLRSHGNNGQDQLPLPDGRTMTRQSFWLNNTYILKQITQNAK